MLGKHHHGDPSQPCPGGLLCPVEAAQAFGARFVKRPQARYYFTRDRSTGKYKIIDRHLHSGMIIAEADFREAAITIVAALNEVTKSKAQPSEHSNIHQPSGQSASSDSPRKAVLGDIFPPAHIGVSGLHRFPLGSFSPPGS